MSAEQHFAEKLHALTRDYGARPNTRIKDLVDLVLLIDSDLTAGPTVVAVARHVFTVRATHPLPVELPDPPSNWQQGFEALAADLNVSAQQVPEAMARVRAFWAASVASHEQDRHRTD